MKGFRSVIWYTSLTLLGVVTMLEAQDIKALLLPIICHIDPAGPEIVNDCTTKVFKWAGAFTSFLGGVGVVLRFVTTSPIFKATIKPPGAGND